MFIPPYISLLLQVVVVVVESGGDEEQWKYVVCWVGKWRKRRQDKKKPSKSQKINVYKMDTKASKCALIFNFSGEKWNNNKTRWVEY